MNPSRISTPVDKKIDEWHFRFLSKTVRFVVSIHRPRDAQEGDDDDRPKVINFSASVDKDDIVKAGIDPKKFATVKLSNTDINALRKQCQAHCHAMLALKWERVIVVGMDTNEKERDDIFRGGGRFDGRRMNPWVNVQFDFAVARQAGKYFRPDDDDDDANYWPEDAKSMLRGFYSHDKNQQAYVYPYSEELHETLVILKDRYIELNRQLTELIKPANMPKLMASVQKLLPSPKAAA